MSELDAIIEMYKKDIYFSDPNGFKSCFCSNALIY